MYDIAASSLRHFDETSPRLQPEQTPRAATATGGRMLAWLTGGSLIAMGALGISSDRILWMFDLASIGVGALALPPVTAWVRERAGWFPRGGFGHAVLGLAALGGAFALNVSPVAQRGATFPVLQHEPDAGFGEISLVDTAAAADRAAATKADYLVQVEAALAAMDREQALASQLDAAPTSYDETVLAERAALVAQRRSITLTPEEAALVNKLAAKVQAARAAMAPGLRRAYVEELNGPLASYGMSARIVEGDAIEFVGAVLADPSRQQTILALTEKERARLGFTSARFVAAGGPAPVDAPYAVEDTMPTPSAEASAPIPRREDGPMAASTVTPGPAPMDTPAQFPPA